ncbi:LysR family transcriptional regulator [Pseudomonas mediterranea]|uniref:DNA-binding transcriptional regulator, LysR family n=1 Tax=Pseudomonas mediterranea TaxID=183795 RepID=A0AAX2DER5_9PSED|nr:LysR family transcriptional regulator [Pseudomonas mediterranea]KGU82929.1 LuxR family transcriptional regulator [Pseudomonas mediterranea CFBP 5447]MBL0845742.1 LysR family transcriptional regulator [Pseudomonas mediterranea]QHA82446.1 LysR family transcriptional regulator [Pseudomonas mediterranea]UZE03261.1 LysR family transcriptional regulator [Pseudomonas mediterranea]SDU63629.1 DNA-binding transcriptional regulator, LysR family [Pseudomonas mediterranea]
MPKKPPLNQVSDFDLRLLRVFKTVVECGSFAGAEGTLGISRSAISLHMSDLEKRLGMRLCQRGRAGFALTDEGREVLRAGETVLVAIEGFRSEVNQMHQQLRGDLNIGIVNNLVTQPRMRITRALKAMRAEGAGVRVNLSMSTPGEIERGLLDGRLHVGAVPLITPLSGLDYSVLYEERSNLYCSVEHPFFQRAGTISNEELATADAVVPSYRMTAEAIGLHQLLNFAASATDREGIAFLILTGSYIGFLPDHYAANWVEKGLMAALSPDRLFFEAKLAIATRKGRRQHLILERFLDALQQSR